MLWLAAAPVGSDANVDQLLPLSPDQKPLVAWPLALSTPAAAMYVGSDHDMSAELPLLHVFNGPFVGLVERSVLTHVPMSPALLMKLYDAPGGAVTSASVTVSSRLSTLGRQVGVGDEAFMVSQMPPPWTCMT